MPFRAGQIVTAGQLNRIQPRPYHAEATVDLVGAVGAADISGATVTFDTLATNAVATVWAFVDFDTTGAGTTTNATVSCVVDGVTQSGVATFQVGAATANDRGTPGQTWQAVLAATGSHTIKLQGTLPTNCEVNAVHTKLTVVVFEVV